MSLLVLLLNEEVTPATPPAATPSKPATAPDERATLQAETRSSPAPTAAEPAEPMYCPMIIKTESLADSVASFTFTEGDGSSPAGGESTRADNVDASESENSSSGTTHFSRLFESRAADIDENTSLRMSSSRRIEQCLRRSLAEKPHVVFHCLSTTRIESIQHVELPILSTCCTRN